MQEKRWTFMLCANVNADSADEARKILDGQLPIRIGTPGLDGMLLEIKFADHDGHDNSGQRVYYLPSLDGNEEGEGEEK